MKIERLIDGMPNGPLIRLFDFTSAEAEMLHHAVCGLAHGEYTQVNLSEQLKVTPVGGFMLLFAAGPHDVGLTSTEARFVWVLRPETWDNMTGLIQPFVEGSTGFQWLSQVGDTSLLLSPNGCW